MIEVQSLSKRYGNFTAVRDLSFGVRAGEVLGLVGPNGAGKTSTLRCLAGIIPASGGVIRIDGTSGKLTAPPGSNPITHWNPAIFPGPMFDPQNGKMMKVKTTKAGAGHWQIRGQTEIDDYYDDAGNWQALKGKLDDGSMVEYRRL